MLLPGLLAFPWGPFLTYTPQFFPPTPCPCPIMVALLPGSLLPSLGLSPVVPRKGPLEAGPGIGSGADPETIPITPPGDNVPNMPFLVAPYPVIPFFFPYFPPGPTPLVIKIIP